MLSRRLIIFFFPPVLNRPPISIEAPPTPRADPTGWRAVQASIAGTIATALGVAVTYTDADGDATEIDLATFVEGIPERIETADGTAIGRAARATFPVANTVTPAGGETITRSGEVWTIVAAPLMVGAGQYWQADLKRTEHDQRTRRGHRLGR